MMNANDLLNIQGDMEQAKMAPSGNSPSMGMGGGGFHFNPMDLLQKIIRNWYWFAVSLTVCMGTAWYLLQKATPVYVRTVSVLIKDKGNSSRVGAEAMAFQEVSGMNFSANMATEIAMFRTERLNLEVVRRLNLTTSYLEKEGLHLRDLYGESPVEVTFDSLSNKTGSFTLTPMQNGKVRLADFSSGEESIEVNLEKPVNTPIGRIEVHPTAQYKKFGQHPIVVNHASEKAVAAAYAGKISAEVLNKEASIVNLSLTDASAKKAEDYLTTLVEVYKEDMINDKNRLALDTERFINERLAVLELDLGNVENVLATFKQENKMTDVMAEAGLATGRVTQYEDEGYALESQLQLVKFIRNYLTDPKKSGELIPSNTGVADVNVESQIGEYNKLLLERDKMLKDGGLENPVVKDLSESLELTRKAIVRTVDNTIASLNIKLDKVRDLEKRSAQRLSAVPQHEKYMLNVERQQKVKGQLYVYLLQKREENALTRSLTESNARLIEGAKGPSGPVSPKAMSYYMAGMLAGVGLPLVVLVLMVLLDNKIYSRKDLEEGSSLPFAGDIPFAKTSRGQDNRDIVVTADGKDMVTEAFRLLRTNLSFMTGAKQQHKVFMATSMNPDAGKTFVLSNLAVITAFAGKRVLLIDLDIRKGSLTRVFKGRKMQGVTHYLSGQVDNVQDLIHAVPEYPGLDIIYRGVMPPNPAELLMSERLDELLEYVKPLYDVVLLDSVPVGLVADAAIVNRLVDRTLFVARAGVLDKRQLPDVEQINREGKMKQAALILNGVKERHTGYGYYGYYGYGYGYGQEGKKKKRH